MTGIGFLLVSNMVEKKNKHGFLETSRRHRMMQEQIAERLDMFILTSMLSCSFIAGFLKIGKRILSII